MSRRFSVDRSALDDHPPRLGPSVVLVHDCDAAAQFYQRALDARPCGPEEGPSRQLALAGAAPTGGDAHLWLVQPRSPAETSIVGRQTGDWPLLVLYTADCESVRRRIVEAGGSPATSVPMGDRSGPAASARDLYGNVILLLERQPHHVAA
ncbi:MAG: hypothetical protein R3181_00305 [Rubricoccaceae bacterium]|nr:hypothetical protein [Rubricoccaceae bacterium]